MTLNANPSIAQTEGTYLLTMFIPGNPWIDIVFTNIDGHQHTIGTTYTRMGAALRLLRLISYQPPPQDIQLITAASTLAAKIQRQLRPNSPFEISTNELTTLLLHSLITPRPPRRHL